MLKGLANYFLGGDGQVGISQDVSAPSYRTTEGDDDWILVDVTNTTHNTTNEMETTVPGKTSSVHLPPLNMNSAELSSPELTPPSSPSQMEGSWYVTPPACFTAGSPVQLATSPLENLLIEHPSMSVYASTGVSSSSLTMQESCSQSLPSASTVIVDSELTAHLQTSPTCVTPPPDMSSDDPPVENREPTRRRSSRSQRRRSVVRDQSAGSRRRNPRRTASLAARAGLIEPLHHQGNNPQKVQHQKGQQKLKRSYLDRQNRVYGFQSSSRHMRRKDRMIRPSGANNNRKCC